MRRRTRSAELQKIILYSIGLVGMLAAGLVAPNVIGAMGKLGLIPKPRQVEYISSSASRLKKRGLLKFADGHYQLTEAGKKVLKRWELGNYKLFKPSRWDGRWRIVIFDIPQKKKKIRDHMTMILRTAGFERLQDSVYVFPFPCEELVGLFKTELGLGKNLLYLIVEELENDKELRHKFQLR